MIRDNSPLDIQITERFFEALNMVIAQKRIRGLQTFTRNHDINRWNFVTIRDNKETSKLKPEYITFIVQDFGVSAHWVLTGEGGMFSESK